ncbi:MAG TPA: nuclear transport factor 2 family protein [Mycobacterium sp.]|uniref:nuclear transport factor 2 family protein n=1 Tax=Mycobacterium sp. TaxID=1785 RepID=UPI002D251EAB|nr:nuclear transport factor 2 family protein [Mycobacterium sp.]HXY64243.1 nuclear transport factor 2 family protein [Mycobacterium sp.]
MTSTANEQLIEAYFRMVKEDDYAGVGSIVTDDATWTIMPIGYTWTGRRAIESMAVAAGRSRRHDQRSHIEIKNWFTDGEHVCVEYKHKLIVRGLGLRLTADGYCLVFHVRDGRFDAIREYINPPHIAAGLILYALLPVLPYLSRRRLARS